MNPSEKIARLMFRFTRGELSSREQAELASWREASRENDEVFLEEIDPEQMQKNYIAMQDNKEAVWKKLQERFPEMLANRSPNTPILSLTSRWIAVAAGVVLIFGLYFLLREPSTSKNTTEAILLDPDGVQTALDDFHRGMMDAAHGIIIKKNEKGVLEYTPRKDSTAGIDRNYKLSTRSGRLILNLVPGIRIWLNDSSSVTFPENTNRDTVQVQLTGESFIDVNRSESQPLVITAIRPRAGIPPNLIKVSNAHINIISAPDGSLRQATVIEGTASIFLSDKVYSLQHGHQAFINSGQVQIIEIPIPETLIQWLK